MKVPNLPLLNKFLKGYKKKKEKKLYSRRVELLKEIEKEKEKDISS